MPRHQATLYVGQWLARLCVCGSLPPFRRQALTKALVQTGLLDERTATEYIDNAMRGADVDSSDAEIPSRHEVEAHEEREEAFRAETEAAVLELGRKAAELDAREQEVVARLPRKPGWLLRGEKFPGETDEDADSVRGSAEVALTSTATGETGNGRRTSDSSVRGVTILQYIEGLVKDIDGDVFGLPESGPSGRGSGAVVPSDAASDWKAKRDKLDLEREYIDPDDGCVVLRIQPPVVLLHTAVILPQIHRQGRRPF